jgi:hypothetical protein
MLHYTKPKNSTQSKESLKKSTKNNDSIRNSIQNNNVSEVFKEVKIT